MLDNYVPFSRQYKCIPATLKSMKNGPYFVMILYNIYTIKIQNDE